MYKKWDKPCWAANQQFFARSKKIRLIAIGNLSKWHGIDRLIDGIAQYYKQKNTTSYNILLHIVGAGKSEEKTRNMVQMLRLDKNIVFHGILKGKELDNLCDQVDIGVGNLGFFRTGLELAFPLKHREYCARGLPFVLSTKDTGFSDGLKWVKYFENKETPIPMDELIQFYEKIYASGLDRNAIRKYAKLNLTWDIEMRKVIDKINNLI